ncbi:MAG: hypothetical protein K8963_01530 [Proteobacteria bacterium]|nr:hypothetical protein [Pseudomonadota bacterium]
MSEISIKKFGSTTPSPTKRLRTNAQSTKVGAIAQSIKVNRGAHHMSEILVKKFGTTTPSPTKRLRTNAQSTKVGAIAQNIKVNRDAHQHV